MDHGSPPEITEHLDMTQPDGLYVRASVVKKGSGMTDPQRKGIAHVARIAGVNIPTAKRVPIALTYITGIGPAKAEEICEAVGIDRARRVNELSDAEVLKIREYIDAT